jgi:hypothetical protein
MKDDSLGPPKLTHSFTEVARTTYEALSLGLVYNNLMKKTPESKPRPILVIPGFGAHDLTTSMLRAFLDSKGHATYGWSGGINSGPSAKNFAHLEARLDDIIGRHKNQKVTLIGHSLGGIFARELAHLMPQAIGQVITMGSPFGAANKPESVNPMVRGVFELINGKNNLFTEDKAFIDRSLQPPPVPTTSIYSVTDGVVNWQTCLNPKRAKSENIEVSGSHCGLVFNPQAFAIITDRLAVADKRHWRPFDKANYTDMFHHGNNQREMRAMTV